MAGKNKTESQKLQHKHNDKLVEFCVSVVDFVILFLGCVCVVGFVTLFYSYWPLQWTVN